jgi:hypothetical protein
MPLIQGNRSVDHHSIPDDAIVIAERHDHVHDPLREEIARAAEDPELR